MLRSLRLTQYLAGRTDCRPIRVITLAINNIAVSLRISN